MTVLNFWTDKVPTAAWITIFWVVIILINVWAVKFFGEVEVVSSSIKFGWIIIVVISLIGEKLARISSFPARLTCRSRICRRRPC